MDDFDDEVADVDLVSQVRDGDRDAAVQLWTRHYPAVLLAARRVTRQPRDAEEIASDAFSGMLSALATGAGPTTSVRAYLVTSVRNLAASRARRPSSGDVITDDVTLFDRAAPDNTAHMSELELVRVAFANLPERWQTVLWRTAVDKDSNIAVGQAMGLSPNGVAALAKRARRGFRRAYLRAHLSDRGVAAECQPFVNGLADLTVSTVGASPALVDHVSTCARCTTRIEELRAVDRSLAGLVAPAVLGLFPSKLVLGGAAGVATATAATTATTATTTATGGGSGGAQALSVVRAIVGSPARWALGSTAAAGVAIAIVVAAQPEAVRTTPEASPHTPPVTSSSTPAPSRTSPPRPTVRQPPSKPSPTAVVTERPLATPSPPPPPPLKRLTPTRSHEPTRTAPPAGPLTVELGIRGTPADTALQVSASVEGTIGRPRLTLELPAGVTLSNAEGDWASCVQTGSTIDCTGSGTGGRWAGTIHTTWAAGARGPVTATVRSTYANGSTASGAAGTSWPP